ncbi:hypothetical protein FIM08_04125 [SAR202 cluster bacterium AC-647-N09_OGT_505m]|nr:hypothetical protein [SAR202 cluster bacterium AC-647-N09_OGT_505m]
MTMTNHTQATQPKNRMPRDVWIFMQGYHTSSLPPRVTWYAPGREFIGRTDNYTMDLYRGKGYVLDKRFLDPMLWDARVNHVHGASRTPSKPCSIVIKPPQPSSETPRLARVLIGVMDDRDYWEGTASELLSLIGDVRDIPKLHNRLSAELIQPYMTDALDAHGITVRRERTSERRMLRLSRV